MKKLNHNKFITDMMRFASSEESPDDIIDHLMQYVCENLESDRAYIFEDNLDGTYDNTYEYCRKGVTAEIDNLKNVPFDNVLDAWFYEYERSHNILIYDIEEYRKVSEPLYDILKPQGIQTLVTGPIEINGRYIGFYGVDNPPIEIMEQISDLIVAMEFVFSMILRIRDYAKAIETSSNTDPLTGCHNRKALNWAYDGQFGEASSISVLMCDLNGLKRKNDNEGHKAGDQYICNLADALAEAFQQDNVYRLGGDEFVVVKLSVSMEQMQQDVIRLKQLCEQKQVSVSCGLAYSDDVGRSFERLLHEADTYMYDEKKKYYETLGIDRRKV